MKRALVLTLRGLLLRCPNCGQPTLARGLLKVHDRCAVCGLIFEHDDGFFLGALVINYLLTALVGIIPAVVAVATGAWSVPLAIVYACAAAVLLPLLFYWHAKSLWMAWYYTFVPDDLQGSDRDAVEAPSAVKRAALSQDERERLRVEEAIAALEGGRPRARGHAR